MRTAKIGLFLLIGTAFMTSGCTASLKSYPFSMMDTSVRLNHLDRKDYQVLGSVEGTAHYSSFLGFGGIDGGNRALRGTFVAVPGGSLISMIVNVETLGLVGGNASAKGGHAAGNGDTDEMLPEPMSPTESAAAYDAMEKQPDADGLINVIITKGERTSFGWLYTDETITLKATAIKIKTG
jgi:hypothetical protein